jgi:hypothetical protein
MIACYYAGLTEDEIDAFEATLARILENLMSAS